MSDFIPATSLPIEISDLPESDMARDEGRAFTRRDNVGLSVEIAPAAVDGHSEMSADEIANYILLDNRAAAVAAPALVHAVFSIPVLADYTGYTFYISNLVSYDKLTLINEGDGPGQVGVSGQTVYFEGVEIGSMTGGSDQYPFIVTFNDHASATAIEAAISRLGYQLARGAPEPTDHSFLMYLTEPNYHVVSVGPRISIDFEIYKAPGGPDTSVVLHDRDAAMGGFNLIGASYSVPAVDDYNGYKISIYNLTAYDRVSLISQGDGPGQVNLVGQTVGYEGDAVAWLSGGTGGSTFTIEFNAAASDLAIEAVIRQLGYQLQTGTVNPVDHSIRLGVSGQDGFFLSSDLTDLLIDFEFPTAVGGPDTSVVLHDREAAIAAPTLIGASFAVPYAATYSGYTLSIQNLADYDRVSLIGEGDGPGQVGVSGQTVTYQGVDIGWLEGGVGQSFAVHFNENASQKSIDAVVGRLAYQLAPGVRLPDDHALQLFVDNGFNSVAGEPLLTIDFEFPNEAPAGTDTSIALDGRRAHVFSAADFGFSDPDGQGFAAIIVDTLPDEGVLMLNGVAVEAGDTIAAADFANLTYTPNGKGSYGFTFQVQDDGGLPSGGLDTDQSPNTITFDVANTAPHLDGIAPTPGFTIDFDENIVNATPQLIAAGAVLTDVDDNFDGGTVVVSGLRAEDHVGVLNSGDGAGEIGVVGNVISYGGIAIGTLDGGIGGKLTITLNDHATSEAVQALIRNLTYANDSDTPHADRTLNIMVTDADAAMLGHGPLGFIAPPQDTYAYQIPGENGWTGGDPVEIFDTTFIDVNGDGVLDLVAGEWGGHVSSFIKNGDGSLTRLQGADNPFAAINLPDATTVASVDIDGDGLTDLIASAGTGIIAFRNQGDGSFSQMSDQDNPFYGVASSYLGKMTLGDVDGDGALDLVSVTTFGNFNYFRNIGGHFVEQTGAQNPFNGMNTGQFSNIALADLDGDGRAELITTVGPENSVLVELVAWHNDGDGFTRLPPSGLPFATDLIIFGVKIADFNNDGTPDLLYNQTSGWVAFQGLQSTGVDITIHVVAQDDAPTAVDATFTIDEDTSYIFQPGDFGFNDTDGDLPLEVIITNPPAHGQLMIDGNVIGADAVIAWSVVTEGRLVFVPAPDGSGTGYASFDYHVRSDSGLDADTSVATNTITIDVTPLNDAPLFSAVAETITDLTDGASVWASGPARNSVSADGNFIVFASFSQLAPSDGDQESDLYLLDRWTGELTHLAPGSNGRDPVISPDGTKVAFISGDALTADDTNGEADVFVLDLKTGVITRASEGSHGAQGIGIGDVGGLVFSPDSSTLAFHTRFEGLVPDDNNYAPDVFLKNLTTGELVRASVGSDGSELPHGGFAAFFSADGSKMGFLIRNDGSEEIYNATTDLMVRDMATGQLSYAVGQIFGLNSGASFTPDGTKILFNAIAENFIPGAYETYFSNFFVDLTTGDVTQASSTSTGDLPVNDTNAALLSPDGNYLVFVSTATNLIPGESSTAESGLFLKNLLTGEVTRLSVDAAGHASNTAWIPVGFLNSGQLVVSYPNDEIAPNSNGDHNDYHVVTFAEQPTRYRDIGDPVTIAPHVAISDVDGSDAAGAVLTVSISNNGTPDDLLHLVESGTPGMGIELSNGDLRFDGTVIGSYTFASDMLIFVFAQGATTAMVQALAEAIQFETVSPRPTEGVRTITFTYQDPYGDAASFDRQVELFEFNTAPVSVDHALHLLEDGAPHIFTLADFGFVPVDAEGDTLATILIDTLPSSGTLMLNDVAVTAGQAIAVADIVAGRLSYIVDPDANGGFDFTFRGQDDRGPGLGEDISNAYTLTLDVAAVNDAPTAGFTAAGYTQADGPAFLVNTTTSGNQSNANIARLADGNLVVSWQDGSADATVIRAQIFTAAGLAVGSEFLVGSQDNTLLQQPEVTGLSDGGFVVTWQALDLETYHLKSYAQVFTAGGVAVGDELALGGGQDQDRPEIASGPNGEFVVAWIDYVYDDVNTFSYIHTQVFGSTGQPIGAEMIVDPTSPYQGYHSVTMFDDGGFVVVWQEDYTGDGNGSLIKAQIFTAEGVALDPFTVSTDDVNRNDRPSVTTLADGRFVVAYMNFDIVTYQTGTIIGQIYSATGEPDGGPFTINAGPEQVPNFPSITALTDGGFVVTWDDSTYVRDLDPTGIAGQVFDAAGNKVGGIFEANSVSAGGQTASSIAAIDGGGFIVTWTDYSGVSGDDWGSAIVAQVFNRFAYHAEERVPLSLKNIMSIGDVDSGDSIITITLSVDDGILNIDTGISGAEVVSGNRTGSVVISGTLAQLQEMLSHDPVSVIDYLVTADVTSPTTKLTLTIDDGGATGIDGPLTASATQVIGLTLINDAPVGTDHTAVFAEDTVYTITAADFGYTDVEYNNFVGVVLTTLPAKGVLMLGGEPVLAGTTVSIADLDAGLLTFAPEHDAVADGYANFTFQVIDDGSPANGGINTDETPRTFTFDVTNVNDAAVVDLNGSAPGVDHAVTYIEGASGVAIGADALISDVDSSLGELTQSMTVKVTDWVAGDVLDFNAVPSSGFTIDASTPGLLVITGAASVEDYQALLATIVYRSTSDSPTDVDTHTTRTVTVTVNDGTVDSAPATTTVTVVGVSDAPDGADNVLTLSEDGSINLLPRDFGFTDIDGDSFAGIYIASLPAHGILTLNGEAVTEAGIFVSLAALNSGALWFLPARDGNGDGYAGFAFQVYDDGSTDNGGIVLDQTPNTITFNVTPVNDVPVLIGGDPVLNLTENDAPARIASDVMLTDPDNDWDGGSITVTGLLAEDRVSVADDPGFGFDKISMVGGGVFYGFALIGIASGGVGGDFTIQLRLDATTAAVEALIEHLTYYNTSEEPTGSRTLEIAVRDGDGALNAGGAIPVIINVTAVNDAPTGTDKIVTVIEDGSHSFAVSDFGFGDVDGDAFTGIMVASLPGKGILYFDGVALEAGSFVSVADIASGKLTYAPAPDGDGDGYAGFTFQVMDDGGTADGGLNTDQSANRIIFNVTPVNDAPVVDLNPGVGSDVVIDLQEGDSAIIAGGATLLDVDSANFDGGTLTVAFGAGATANDVLSIGTGSAVSLVGNMVRYNGQVVGTYTGGTGLQSLVISFNASATQEAVQTLLASISFANESDTPAASRTISFTLTDGDGGTSAPVTAIINVAPVDDAVHAAADASATTETAPVTIDVRANDIDPDGGPGETILQINGIAVQVGVPITLPSGAKVTLKANGQLTYDPNGAYNWLISPEKAAATGASNSFAVETFTYTLSGGGTASVDVRVNGVDGPGDHLVGGAGADTITGTAAADYIDGGAGADTMSGGLGDDIYIVDQTTDVVIEKAYQGTDTVMASASFTLVGYVENLTLTGNAAINGTGNSLANVLTGNGAANILSGGDGNDTINGGGGADTMIGGFGDDVFYVDQVGDLAVEASGQGNDTVYASISYSLVGQYIERLILTGGSAINGTGNGLANVLIGNAANNILDGGDGNDDIDGGGGVDTMIGGLGDDTFHVDQLGDIAIEAANSGYDTVRSSITYSLAGQYIEALILTGNAAIDGTGNKFDNALTGNGAANTLNGGDGNDTIDGGAGADTMIGGLGDDIFYVDNIGDVTVEANGQGYDTVYASVTYSLAGQFIEVLALTGSTAIDAFGNKYANVLIGNSGANQLHGGLGTDTLTGGGGADGFWFETALGSGNIDTITDFNVADDTIYLGRTVFNGIGAGPVREGIFVLGTAAQDADDRIIYDSVTGNIYYDADGVGGAAAVQFAKVTAGTLLTHDDFVVIGQANLAAQQPVGATRIVFDSDHDLGTVIDAIVQDAEIGIGVDDAGSPPVIDAPLQQKDLIGTDWAHWHG